MRQHLATSLLAVAAAAALAGCGGGGSEPTLPTKAVSPFMGTTVQSLLAYMNQLMAQTSETTEPEPVNSTPLPVDDTV